MKSSADNLADYLGVPKYRYGEVEDQDQVGIVTGLAWTDVGGELLTIEAAMMQGKGRMTVTGNLRDGAAGNMTRALKRAKAVRFLSTRRCPFRRHARRGAYGERQGRRLSLMCRRLCFCRAAPCVLRHEHGAADCQQSQRTARMFTNAVISGGRNVSVPGSQSKLVTTLRASKDANFGVATRHWYDSD